MSEFKNILRCVVFGRRVVLCATTEAVNFLLLLKDNCLNVIKYMKLTFRCLRFMSVYFVCSSWWQSNCFFVCLFVVACMCLVSFLHIMTWGLSVSLFLLSVLGLISVVTFTCVLWSPAALGILYLFSSLCLWRIFLFFGCDSSLSCSSGFCIPEFCCLGLPLNLKGLSRAAYGSSLLHSQYKM